MSQTDDIHTRLPKLTEAQCECLRLVNSHLTSKEIAIRVGVSRHTIDQRLDRACKTLGVSTRKEAARLFALYDPIIYEPFDIADMTTAAPDFPDLDYREEGNDRHSDYHLSDASTPFITDGLLQTQQIAMPFPQKRGDANALSIKQRLIWAVFICCVGIMISGLLIAALETLGRLL
jgi:DNA-binding CsgD family transcriptional regulator